MSREDPLARAERITAELRAATAEAAGVLKDLHAARVNAAGIVAQLYADAIRDQIGPLLNDHAVRLREHLDLIDRDIVTAFNRTQDDLQTLLDRFASHGEVVKIEDYTTTSRELHQATRRMRKNLGG